MSVENIDSRKKSKSPRVDPRTKYLQGEIQKYHMELQTLRVNVPKEIDECIAAQVDKCIDDCEMVTSLSLRAQTVKRLKLMANGAHSTKMGLSEFSSSSRVDKTSSELLLEELARRLETSKKEMNLLVKEIPRRVEQLHTMTKYVEDDLRKDISAVEQLLQDEGDTHDSVRIGNKRKMAKVLSQRDVDN